jgi:PKD repeat protein
MKNPVPIEAFCHIPAVDFTARPVSGVVPLEVKFTALSIGDMTSWNWDFGDGTTSTERNPVHTYTAPGVYSVVLVGSDGTRSYSEDKSDYIYVTTGCLPGLFGTYYDNYKDQAYTVPFTGNKYTRIDPRIWFADKESKRESDINDWPKPTLTKTEKFSVEYEGFIIIPKDDTYTFHLTSDDGSVLWIGNTANTDPVLINNWGEHAYFTVSADKYLTKGKHPIRIKMTENKEAAVLHFEWESASIPRQPVESFCHGSGTLPIADFVAEPLDGLKPLNVQFTDRSTGSTMTSWLWNFGDGTTSTQQNPMHTYTSAGDYTVQLKAKNPYGENTRVKTGYIHVEEKLTAGFKATPLSGFAPLMVTFTDQTTGVPTSWHWDFGDGTTSTERNPVHTYASAGTYSVNLTVTNAYESDTLQRTNYIKVSVPFGDYIVDENILLYGNKLIFRGKTLNGPDATIHITGNTLGSDTLGGNAQISVSNIYVNGPINWNSGSGILGSAAKPGTIYVDGGLTLTGVIEVYGNVSVNGKFLLKNSVIHGNVYVNGDLELGWGAPNLDDANVYYTGAFTYPTGMGNGVLNKCVKVASIPEFVVPSYTMPSVKTDSWYTSNGYASSGALKSNVKIAANSYTPNNYQLPATNVIIVAKTGNINLGQNGGGVVTGILFAPNGKVILKDKSFEGVVIAKEFEVLDGSNVVTFKNLNQYIGNPANYPF